MKIFKTAILFALAFTVLLGIVYPCFIWGVGEIFFHKKARGTLFISRDGIVIGSEWIGQNFTSPQYFHPRPSSAGSGYDATSSAGSNMGPTSQKLIDAVKQRVADYRSLNSLSSDTLIPADAVTASASGLDPHISVANAKLQAARIASARNLPLDAVMHWIEVFTEGWLFQEKRVNVLRLNLEMDTL